MNSADVESERSVEVKNDEVVTMKSEVNDENEFAASEYEWELNMLFEELRLVLIADHNAKSRGISQHSTDGIDPGSKAVSELAPYIALVLGEQRHRVSSDVDDLRKDLRSLVVKLREVRAELETSLKLKAERATLRVLDEETMALKTELRAVLKESRKADEAMYDLRVGTKRNEQLLQESLEKETKSLQEDLHELRSLVQQLVPREKMAIEQKQASEKELVTLSKAQKRLEAAVAMLQSELASEHTSRRQLEEKLTTLHSKIEERRSAQRKQEEAEAGKRTESKEFSAVTAASKTEKFEREAAAPLVQSTDQLAPETIVFLERLDKQQKELVDEAFSRLEPVPENPAVVAAHRIVSSLQGLRRAKSERSRPLLLFRRNSGSSDSGALPIPPPSNEPKKKKSQIEKEKRAQENLRFLEETLESLQTHGNLQRLRLEQYDQLINELTEQLIELRNQVKHVQSTKSQLHSQIQHVRNLGAREAKTAATSGSMDAAKQRGKNPNSLFADDWRGKVELLLHADLQDQKATEDQHALDLEEEHALEKGKEVARKSLDFRPG
eukprot:CAMPEP_0182447732 /NCGR_PEP_ID=MMETSP1172-20130603/19505_1 /TAXON_ID=708627 /ORGANISM="Timspurckia oligopyrenoides, Strain CCMP3278" /LENGTH=554 /DNA_ID=CAMNT_0024644279 /DNA_START=30 /DNA_END=1694 /DNA_ORIENTATION=-